MAEPDGMISSALTRKEQPPNILLDLPEDILLAILFHLPCISLVQTAATCRALYVAINSKTVWLDALENMRRIRPVPLSYRNTVSRGTTSELPLESVREAVIRAAKLEKGWSQKVIKPTSFRYVQILNDDERDMLRMAFNAEVGRYLMTYSALGLFTCTIMESMQAITFRTEPCNCWDFDFDAAGVTIVFNTDGFGRGPYMDVYRIELIETSCRLVTTTPTPGNIRSNFLEDDIAGCIISSPGDVPTFVVEVVNWRTGKWAIIKTGVPSSINLSASTTKDNLLFCCGTMSTLDSWTYDFAFLQQCTAKAESPQKPYIMYAPPKCHFRTQYVPQDIVSRPIILRSSLYLTTRGMWTGRQCIWSVFPKQPGIPTTFVYALIPDESSAAIRESSSETPEASPEVTKEFKSASRRTFIYNAAEGTEILSHLTAMGHSGKHAAWIENVQGEYACRIATFRHDDDAEEGPVTTDFSTVEWNHEGFSWQALRKLEIDENAGIVTCVTQTGVWNLYFD